MLPGYGRTPSVVALIVDTEFEHRRAVRGGPAVHQPRRLPGSRSSYPGESSPHRRRRLSVSCPPRRGETGPAPFREGRHEAAVADDGGAIWGVPPHARRSGRRVVRVWAPNARRQPDRRVQPLGRQRRNPMRVLGSVGVWEAIRPGFPPTAVQVPRCTAHGPVTDRADPFAFATEFRRRPHRACSEPTWG